jgi:hypothetical protein
MVVQHTPESPDNQAIRKQLEELKKMNASSARYNKTTIVLSVIILVVTVLGVVVTWVK